MGFGYGRMMNGMLRLSLRFTSPLYLSPGTHTPTRTVFGLCNSFCDSFGHNKVSAFERPCLPPCLSQVRYRSWTELKDCKHWLITLKFPEPKPTRQEMIETYVKTLANVLGREEEAKRKIYALSTTVYTGFQCNIDEATSEKLKEQPLVNWVLPDGYGDPELGIFGGDRYNNGVVIPDPNPPKPYYERHRQRDLDRQRYDTHQDSRGPGGEKGTGDYGHRNPVQEHIHVQPRDGIDPVQVSTQDGLPSKSYDDRGSIQCGSQAQRKPQDVRREPTNLKSSFDRR
eukprot:TRINITY_DN19442_c0_g1_i1.p1 TRINITY_DN19442_c0_g1~~TRINITY_DN19442_c0_g1_i1.p1  ORF type:complete len:284 (+),score=31.78 TRINITY_DN19442_c0_g1_i1:157-1008(+)